MRNIVKGNDINILWDIVRKVNGQDEPYDLTGRNLSLYLVTPLGQDVIEDFTTQGNTIIWTFKGMDQKVLGVYSLKLVINESQPYMQTVDECNVLRLVEHSCMAGGHDDEGIKVETISLIAHIDVAAIIPDTSLNANSQNVVTNAAITQGLDAMHQELSQDIESSTAVINNEVKAVKQELSTINASKANTFGRYPGMSVGFSDDLVGRGESVPAEFSFRASGGKSIKDGAARIKRLKGNSVVWNQFVNEKVCEFTFGQGITGGLVDGKIVLNGKAVGDTFIRIVPYGSFVYRANHKYALIKEGSEVVGAEIKDINTFLFENTIGSVSSDIDSNISVVVYDGVTITDYQINSIRVIDLTKMFGAGNEPSTIEEFNARKPIVADEYAYNEGEVIHMTAEGIKSVGDNAWDEEWELGFIDPTNGNERSGQDTIRSKNFNKIIGGEQYVVMQDTGGNMAQDTACALVLYDEDKNFIDFWGIPEVYRELSIDSRARYFKIAFKVAYGTTYKNDVMISLMHSGWKADTDAKYQPYWEDRLMFDKRIKDEFPNGMHKWDIVYNRNGKGYIVKGTGVADLGRLNWEKGWYNEADNWRIYAEFRQKAIGLSNMINCIYPNANTGDNAMADKTITGHDNPDLLYIYLRDTSYSAEGADALIASLQDVPLYYQLAEPTVIEYDEPFNLDYRVADFGTEEIIAEQPSAPLAADIIYQFNAVDMIREHELEITELQRIIATMQAQLTSLTNR